MKIANIWELLSTILVISVLMKLQKQKNPVPKKGVPTKTVSTKSTSTAMFQQNSIIDSYCYRT